jgi:hypothetical protein
MVFMIEDIYRNIKDGSINGPIYKTYLDWKVFYILLIIYYKSVIVN